MLEASRGARDVSYVRRDSSRDPFDVAPLPTQVMPASKAAQALAAARKEALRKQLGYPEGFDMDAHREAILRLYEGIHRTRNWTDHNDIRLTLRTPLMLAVISCAALPK